MGDVKKARSSNQIRLKSDQENKVAVKWISKKKGRSFIRNFSLFYTEINKIIILKLQL